MMNTYADSPECFKRLKRTPYQLVAILTATVLLVSSLSVYGLYVIGFEEQKNRLVEIAKSRAGIIEALSGKDALAASKKYGLAPGSEEDVLAKLMHSHNRFSGFGKTGEFTLARREGDAISFLLHHRHDLNGSTMRIPWVSTLAEPMRRALQGHAGTVVGADYRGETVLAAFEPIDDLQWGIVAKMDLAELRLPYLDAALVVLGSVVLLILMGSVMVVRTIHPLFDEIENARRYNLMLFNETPVGLALCDMEGKMVDVNPAFAAIIGVSVEEAMQIDYWEITPESYWPEEREQLKMLETTGRYGPYEKAYRHRSGRLVEVRLSGRIVERDGRQFIWSSAEDISDAKRKEEALRQAALVFENTHEGIIITDALGKIIRVNSTFTDLTGYRLEDVVGKDPNILKSGRHDYRFYRKMWSKILNEGMWYGEIWNQRKDGTTFATLQSISAVRDDKGDVSGYVSIFSDISNIKAYQQKLAHLASHDTLTDLPNRMQFETSLDQALRIAHRDEYRLGVLFLDLNRFKEVNDTLGHAAGDTLLKAFAQRVKSSLREEDTVARLGGDEFAVILPKIEDAEDAEEVARKIVTNLQEPVQIDEQALHITTSIGISLYPEDGTNADMLLSSADNAMYRAKHDGDNLYRFVKDKRD